MNINQQKTQKLFHFVIRVPKAEAAFTYFTLESNENLCFYSTLPNSYGQTFCDIDIKGGLDMQAEVERLLQVLSKKYPLAILENQVIADKPQGERKVKGSE